MQTIGERLEEARKKKGISIREAAEATKIRGDYLQKFESNHFDIGLTEIYTRGFLRTYANFLKIPADRIVNDYAALGRGDVRPRQPNREVYGRMDITVASSGEASDRAAPPSEGAAAEAGGSRPPMGGRSRSATSLPSGPDPAVIFRYVKWGGIAVVAILAIIVIKSLFTSTPVAPSRNPTPPTTTQTPAGPVFKLLPLNQVQVTIYKVNPDGTYGEIVFERALVRGENVSRPHTSEAYYIKAVPPENLEMEIEGRILSVSRTLRPGENTVRLEPSRR